MTGGRQVALQWRVVLFMLILNLANALPIGWQLEQSQQQYKEVQLLPRSPVNTKKIQLMNLCLEYAGSTPVESNLRVRTFIRKIKLFKSVTYM